MSHLRCFTVWCAMMLLAHALTVSAARAECPPVPGAQTVPGRIIATSDDGWVIAAESSKDSIYVSTNAGASFVHWGNGVPPTNGYGSTWTVAANGDIYFAARGYPDRFWKSCAETFQEFATTALPTTHDPKNIFVRAPAIAIVTNDGYSSQALVSVDNGLSFSPPVAFPDGYRLAGVEELPNMAVDSTGRFCVTWTVPIPGHREIWFAQLAPHATAFDVPELVTSLPNSLTGGIAGIFLPRSGGAVVGARRQVIECGGDGNNTLQFYARSAMTPSWSAGAIVGPPPDLGGPGSIGFSGGFDSADILRGLVYEDYGTCPNVAEPVRYAYEQNYAVALDVSGNLMLGPTAVGPLYANSYNNSNGCTSGCQAFYTTALVRPTGAVTASWITVGFPSCSTPAEQAVAWFSHDAGERRTRCMEAVDAANPAWLVNHELSGDPQLMVTGGRSVVGVVADGTSQALLRLNMGSAGTLTLSLSDPAGGGVDGLGTLAPLGGGAAGTSITVTSNNAGIALAAYRAPADFVRSGVPSDASAAKRTIDFDGEFVPQNGDPPSEVLATLGIVRPPAVFCHGFASSSETWRYPQVLHDPRWQVTQVDYRDHSGSRLSRNVGSVGNVIGRARNKMREQGYACSQVDYVAHSMGGLLGRLHASSNGYLSDDNLGQGDFHKFITIDTPHTGTQLANIAVAMRDEINNPTAAPGKRLMYWSALAGLGSVLGVDYSTVTAGAIDDFSAGSVAIQQLAPLQAPTHAHVGTGGSDLLLPGYAIGAGPYGFFLLLLDKWRGITPSIIFGGDQHDFLVKKSSQEGGLTGQAVSKTTYFNGTHTSVGVSGSGVTASPEVGIIVENLLQASVASPLFAPGLPAGATLALPTDRFQIAEALKSTTTSITDGGLGIRFLEPADGAVVRPGDAVYVRLGGIAGRPLSSIAMVAGDSALFLTGPVFGDTLHIPANAAGPIQLEASGLLADSSFAVSQPVVVQVVPADTLQGLQLQPSTASFDAPGQTAGVRVIGSFCKWDPIYGWCVDTAPDLDITKLSGVTWSSDNPSIAVVGPDGIVMAVGAGSTGIHATYGGFDGYASVSVQAGPRANNAPKARAGGPYFSRPALQVCLDARQSTDPDTLFGDHLHFAWDLNADGIYTDAASAVACMTAGSSGSYSIGLLVTDDAGDSSLTRTMLTVSDSAQVLGVLTPIVPALNLSLRVLPNPSTTGGLAVELSLPQRGPAKLEVFDISGRRVAQRDLSAQSPGQQRIALRGQVFAPGVYIVRLAQGARRTTARAVVVR